MKRLEVQKRLAFCSPERVELVVVDGWSWVDLPLRFFNVEVSSIGGDVVL